MNARQRRKLFAGAGLISMLCGALMVLVPAGAGATQGGGNEDCPAGTVQVAKFNWSGNSYAPEGGPGPVTIGQGSTASSGTWSSTTPIQVVIVKGSTDAKQVVVNGATQGTFDGTGLVNGGDNQPAISNVKFCAPTTGSLSVDKDLAGNDAAAEAGTVFSFTVSCTGATLAAGDASFTLTAAQTKTITGLPVGSSCTVTESDDQDADATTYKIGAAAPADGTVASGATIAAGATTAVLFTNTYNSETLRTGSLSVDKDLAGNDAAAEAGTVFSFTVSCTGATLAAGDASFTLTAAQTKTITGLPVGSSCTVTESDDQDADATTYKIGAAAPADGTVASGATIAAGATTAVLFTNTYNDDTPQPPPAEEEADLTIVKAWEGEAPSDWAVQFTGDLDSFELTATSDENSVSVDPGTYTVTEATSEDYELFDASCDGGQWGLAGESVTVTLADGDDVTCTFVNEAVDEQVLPNEETPKPTETPKPAEAPKAANEVKGVQVTRQLPRTGSEATDLAGYGAGLLLLGAGLVITSRARRFGIDA